MEIQENMKLQKPAQNRVLKTMCYEVYKVICISEEWRIVKLYKMDVWSNKKEPAYQRIMCHKKKKERVLYIFKNNKIKIE